MATKLNGAFPRPPGVDKAMAPLYSGKGIFWVPSRHRQRPKSQLALEGPRKKERVTSKWGEAIFQRPLSQPLHLCQCTMLSITVRCNSVHTHARAQTYAIFCSHLPTHVQVQRQTHAVCPNENCCIVCVFVYMHMSVHMGVCISVCVCEYVCVCVCVSKSR